MSSTSPQVEAASSSGTSVAIAAESTITDLTFRFPGKVQIHLHPSSSLPSSITSTSTSSSDGLNPALSASSPELPVPLVWTVDSLKLLRSYGLTGSFTGTLAQFPQQNIFLGLPIQLLPEEVVYLLRRDLAVVVDEAKSYRDSTSEELAKVKGKVDEDRQSQQLAAWHERQLLRAKHSKSPSSSSSTTNPPKQEELESLPWHYTIPTTSSHLGWYTPVTYTTLSSVQELFTYPSTEMEVASVGLFEHLVGEKGMWCMNGLRFGGAFAVYPGDPLRYHSHYTAQLVLQKENVALTSLVANGRLGTAVKKTHLLCCVEHFDSQLRLGEVQEGRRRGERRALKSVKAGVFDIAPKNAREEEEEAKKEEKAREAGSKFADFNVFSLAWAGFGT